MAPTQNNSTSQPTHPARATAGSREKPSGEAKPPQPPLVKPVIFRYTCRGALYLDDSRAGAAAEGRSGHFDGATVPPSLSTPRCAGIESRLRKIRELPPASRDDAVRDFVERTAVMDVGYDGRDREREVARTSGRIGGTAIGDKPRLGPAAALPVGPDAADYGEEEEENGTMTRRRLSGGVKVGMEEERSDQEDSWSSVTCYGTTQVSVLMLRDSKKAEVAAVAPENTLGVTLRDEGDSTGGEATTTLRLGPIEVTVGNHYEYEEEEEDSPKKSSGEIEDRSKGQQVSERPVWDPNQDIEGIRPIKGKGKRPQGDRSRIQSSSSESDEDFSERFLRTLQRTAEAMKNNAKMVTNEVNDEFPSRVVRSGERIVGQFGKTVERTKKVAQNMYHMWWNDDDDDDK